MHPEALIQQLANCRTYFERSTSCLTEKDSNYAPQEELFTVAQQVTHVAHTIDWFRDGALGPGFDMDFSNFDKVLADVKSLDWARNWLDKAFKDLEAEIRRRSPEELAESLPEGPIMGGAPRGAVVQGVMEHTAHHRGVLTVYSRLLGYTPTMPYV